MGAFPRSSPFNYTAISAYVFDQVLTFTNMNTFLGNVDELASAFKVEHNYDSGDGTHGRITLEPNLIINPTARRGNAFWWSDGGAIDPDPEYANAPIWDDVHWTDNVATGSYWKLSSLVASTQGDLSEKITTTNGINIVLSGEITVQTRSAGSVELHALSYDNAGNFISSISIVVSASVGWTKYEVTGTTPANTAYIRVWKWVNGLTCDLVAIRAIKLERGTIATTYTDESSMPQYLSAKYLITAGSANLSLADDNVEILDYDQKIFDDPGTDRITPGVAWVFTADRYMKLNVKASIWLEVDTWANGSFFILSVKKPNSVVREIIGFRETTGVVTRRHFLNGSTEVELNKGETFWIEAYQNSGGAVIIETAAIVYDGVSHISNYISIEEI